MVRAARRGQQMSHCESRTLWGLLCMRTEDTGSSALLVRCEEANEMSLMGTVKGRLNARSWRLHGDAGADIV